MRGFHNQPWLLRVLSRAREKKMYLVLKQDDAWALRQQKKINYQHLKIDCKIRVFCDTT